MATYSIKKTNNGEYKEIEKTFVLDVTKFRSHCDTLCFDVEGEEIPAVFDFNLFESIMMSQIQQGFMESLEYKDGLLTATTRDGNTIKKYTYDFGWSKFSSSQYGLNSSSALDDLKRTVYKIVSFYNENPNRELISQQKYVRMILDIMDGDRLPKIEEKDEILRIFQVYHSAKSEILEILLENVVFYDDNDNVIDYGKFLRTRKLEAIKYDVLSQMEIKMLMFAVNNNAYELYQEYNSKTHIPRVEIEYKYVDEEGNEIEPPVEEYEAGTIFSVGRELLNKGVSEIKKATSKGIGYAVDKISYAKEKNGAKLKEKKRTK